MPLLGSGVIVSFKAWLADGVTPTTATNPVVTLRRPTLADVTYSGASVVFTAPNVYTVTFPKTDLTELGHYAWVAAADSPQTVLGRKAFDVTDPFLPSLITLDDARSALGKTPRNVDLEELQLHVDTANEQIEILTGPAVPRVVTDVLTPDGDTLRLSRPPGLGDGAFLTLTAATLAGVSVDFAAQWARSGGRVTARSGYVLADAPYTIVYRVGRQPIPASLFTAARVLVQHLWQTQRAQPAGITADGLDVVQTGYGFAIPNRVAELVARYSNVAGVA